MGCRFLRDHGWPPVPLLPATAAGIALALREKRLSAREVATWHLERIARLDPALFMRSCSSMPSGRSPRRLGADARLARGDPSPLLGVPFVVKDNIWVGGCRITQGSRLFRDFVAPESALPVRRMEEAGAVLLGIGACPEFACKGSDELTALTAPPATPGTSAARRADRRAARRRRWLRGWHRWRSQPTPADQFAARRRTRASSASSRHADGYRRVRASRRRCSATAWSGP